MPVKIPTMPLPSEDALQGLATVIGRQLPSSYIQFVREHDGARPEENSVVTRDNQTRVRQFVAVTEAAPLAQQIDGFPQHVIPFAEDDCGNYFYVDPQSGGVWFWDHEIEGADEQVAADITSFVAKLMPFDAGAVNLEPCQVRSAWIDPSFKRKF